MTHTHLLKPITLALAAALAAPALAADDYRPLDESVVSAAGYEQDSRQAPASISIVAGEQLHLQSSTDLGEAIQEVPGVDIEQTKMGGHTIRLRG